jgi:hypothetical protein
MISTFLLEFLEVTISNHRAVDQMREQKEEIAMDRSDIRLGAVIIDCARDQVHPLILLYTMLLGLKLDGSEEDGFPYLVGDGFGITLQVLEDYMPPT